MAASYCMESFLYFREPSPQAWLNIYKLESRKAIEIKLEKTIRWMNNTDND